MLFWLIILHIFFGAYFVYTGNWYLCFLPIIFLISISTLSNKKLETPSIKSIYYDNMFVISWFMIMFGFGGLLYFGGVSYMYIIWIMIISNSMLMWLSYIWNYDDGKTIFEYWYWISMLCYIVFLWWNISTIDTSQIISLISIIPIYSACLYAWLHFVIWNVAEIPESNYYKIIFWINATVTYVLIYIFKNNLAFGILAAVWYTAWVSRIYEYLSSYYFQINTPKSLDLKYILRGNKLFELPPDDYNADVWNLRKYIKSAPRLFQISHNITITILISVMTIFLFWNGLLNYDIYLFVFIVAVLIYIYNFYISQKLELDIEIQKIYIFFMVNLLWYMIIYLLVWDPMSRLILGVMRNVFTSLAIVYYNNINILNVGRTKIDTFDFLQLRHQDINYWIASNIIGLIMNIYNVIMTNLDTNFKIFFVLLLTGAWARLMMYVIKVSRKN